MSVPECVFVVHLLQTGAQCSSVLVHSILHPQYVQVKIGKTNHVQRVYIWNEMSKNTKLISTGLISHNVNVIVLNVEIFSNELLFCYLLL